MRVIYLVACLGIAALLAGCQDRALMTISGTARTLFDPQAGVTILLLQDGAQVGPAAVTAENGDFRFDNVAPGRYVLCALVSPQGQLYYGPINVGAVSPPHIDLLLFIGLIPVNPGPNTAIVAASAIDNGMAVNHVLRLEVNGVSTQGTPPVILQDITGGLHTVTITDTVTGKTAVLTNLPIANGKINAIWAVLE